MDFVKGAIDDKVVDDAAPSEEDYLEFQGMNKVWPKPHTKAEARKLELEVEGDFFDAKITDDEQEGAKRKKIKFKSKKLVINLKETKYHIIRYVAKLTDLRLTKQEDDWDILWTDDGVTVDRLYKMKPYQKINHFPGMYALARKDHLARNLNRMQKRFPEDYKFFPQTWLLPAEFGDFRKQFKENTKGKPGRKTFICKPEASCQGKGVFLT